MADLALGYPLGNVIYIVNNFMLILFLMYVKLCILSFWTNLTFCLVLWVTYVQLTEHFLLSEYLQ